MSAYANLDKRVLLISLSTGSVTIADKTHVLGNNSKTVSIVDLFW